MIVMFDECSFLMQTENFLQFLRIYKIDDESNIGK
jgi:hypothetical protein